ncbi:MAG: amino acid ABC transporter permease [Spiribacter sp.]|jgi:glutamate/aspartate transport system permease protein|nr:amino acid ABC transporter permease [Spiribacter sp.]MDR9490151.1 amino acid ABC transporter permease [Spiribacter sp.]
MEYNWDWSVLFQVPYFGWLISGIQWTLLVAGCAWVIAFLLGSLIGVSRTLRNPILRGIGAVYVEVFRGIPLLVQLFIWYFVVPELLPQDAGMWVKRELPQPEFTTAVICLGTYTAARVAEQVRSGLQSLSGDLSNAGRAIGLTERQNYLHIRLPVAYRIILPPLTSEFLTTFKNSSLALTIGVLELTAQSRQIENYTFHGFEAFTAATVIYLVITLSVVAIMRGVDRYLRIPTNAGGSS